MPLSPPISSLEFARAPLLAVGDVPALVALVLGIALALIALSGVLYAGYYLVSLPLRRQERARLFLEVVATSLRQGFRVEDAMVALSKSREHSIGLRFHLLAAYLEEGLRLSEGLARVPSFLPAPVTAMLRVGEEIGDLGRVLPATRAWLRAGTAQTFKMHHYLVLGVLLAPLTFVVLQTLAIWILPKISSVVLDFAAETNLAERSIALDVLVQNWWVTWLTLFVPLLLLASIVVQLAAPHLTRWTHRFAPQVLDWAFYLAPWRRKRLLRDFSAMLAVLLDAGVPEDRAVTLAAECTANDVFKRLAAQAVADLRQGAKLTEAIRRLDQQGDFQWRLANAARAKLGFLDALRGWHQALEAKAFQQEQIFTQAVTSGMVLLNGFIVGWAAVAVFTALLWLLNAACLW